MTEKDRHTKWLEQQNFYHGFLPREDLLYVLKKSGDYILRTTDRPGPKGVRQRDLILSVIWTDNNAPLASTDIRNFIVKRNPAGKFCIDTDDRFDTIQSLLNFYEKYPIKMKTKVKIRLMRPIPLLSWEFRNKEVVLLKKVGQGAYGEVYKGKVKKRNGKTFEAAIKTMKADIDANDERMKEVMAEARLMRCLNHPNIVRIRGIAVTEAPFYIIIDFIDGGGLDSYLKKNKNVSIDVKNKMAVSAAWGIEFIHSQSIIHRDIAARNCLFDKTNYVKLSDFGLSRKGTQYKMKTARRMPTKWLAPESLRTFTFYPASDVFTYGLLLYEIYTVKEPYDNIGGAEAKKRTLTGEYPNFEAEAPPELYSIVREMVYVDDHEKRAPMSKIVKSLEEWLQVELVLDKDENAVEDEKPPANVDLVSGNEETKTVGTPVSGEGSTPPTPNQNDENQVEEVTNANDEVEPTKQPDVGSNKEKKKGSCRKQTKLRASSSSKKLVGKKRSKDIEKLLIGPETKKEATVDKTESVYRDD